MSELPIIQKTYDLIKWYVPILNRLPRDHKFALGERIIAGLYDLLEGFIQVRYTKEKLPQLKALNIRLEILRHQTRLLLDFQILSTHRYAYVGQQINGIGTDLGGWIKRQPHRVRHSSRSGSIYEVFSQQPLCVAMRHPKILSVD